MVYFKFRDLDNIQFSVKFHETLSSKAKENKKCGACQRGFVSDEELAKFERYCQKTIEKIPKERAQLEDQLKDWIAELADLKPLLSSEITLNKLRDTELSKLQLENDRLKSELDIANSKSRQAQSEVERLKDRLSELRLCRRPINDMIRMEDEINELKREISQLESELETCGSLRTSEEVQDQLDCQTLEI
ncbi:expressed protein [Phakopsora pachyrhizi]|uniref:Expressed protein n=1 Tax=Phakopsora pachyrhizi TaxID=170000 RepID=A0AAV0ACR2_PHAPC|nr:expressed protein [Phakopsora pachyrhizi]